jgi:hypothetical protein
MPKTKARSTKAEREARPDAGLTPDRGLMDSRLFQRLCHLANLEPEHIEALVDEDGEIPEPPTPAFRQVVDGRTVDTFTTHEMVQRILQGE